MTEELMTLEEVCAYLKVRKSTIYEWVKNGEIPFIRKGKKIIRFRKAKIDEWLRSMENSCDERMRILESIR